MQLDRRTLAGLLLCGLASLTLRTVFVADEVFVNGDVRFQETDPWYHVRLIDNTVRTFPHRIAFDPWAVAPGGHVVPVAPLFDQAVAGLALLVGLGHPSEHLTHVIAALVPALLGALLVVPVYFIGRIVWTRGVGLVAAGWVAIAPGVLLGRTRLGYVDHHVAESLLSALAVMALIMALTAAEPARSDPRGTAPAGPRDPWPIVRRSLLFGVFLAAYLSSWIGGFLLVVVFASWIAAQMVSDHLRTRDTRRIAWATVPGLSLALALVFFQRAALPLHHLHLTALTVAIALAIGLTAVSALTTGCRRRRLLFFAVAGLGAIAAVAILGLVAPDTLIAPLGLLRRFVTPGAGLEVAEIQPLLARTDTSWLRATLLEFTTGAVLGAVGLLALLRSVIRRGDPRQTLVLVWSVLMIGATLVQVRFAYYSALNVALLTAVACRIIWRWAARPVPNSRGRTGDLVTGVALALVAFGPGLIQAPQVASHYSGPNADWIEVLNWMREETPSPSGGEEALYGRFTSPEAAAPRDRGEEFYSVMNWWDYGYWILAEARRVPASIPTQAGASAAARFYMAQSEPEANPIVDSLASRYVLLDATLPLLNPEGSNVTSGKFGSLAIWAGRRPEEFFETYYAEQPDGSVAARVLYYPEYFRTMLVRLYLYQGAELPDTRSVRVVSFVERVDASGDFLKMVTGWREFPTYREAESWRSSQTDPERHRVVSDDPHASCTPLEPLRRYRLAHRSQSTVGWRTDAPISYIEVFEITRPLGDSAATTP